MRQGPCMSIIKLSESKPETLKAKERKRRKKRQARIQAISNEAVGAKEDWRLKCL